VGDYSDRTEYEATAPQYRCGDAGLARPGALDPSTEDGRRNTEKHEKEGVHPAEAGDLPVAGGREQFGDNRHARARLRGAQAKRPRQRQPEDTKAVRHADAEMDTERGWRHQPAIEAGLGDDAFAVENVVDFSCGRQSLIECRHPVLHELSPRKVIDSIESSRLGESRTHDKEQRTSISP
jgi:hypothetical protein